MAVYLSLQQARLAQRLAAKTMLAVEPLVGANPSDHPRAIMARAAVANRAILAWRKAWEAGRVLRGKSLSVPPRPREKRGERGGAAGRGRRQQPGGDVTPLGLVGEAITAPSSSSSSTVHVLPEEKESGLAAQPGAAQPGAVGIGPSTQGGLALVPPGVAARQDKPLGAAGPAEPPPAAVPRDA